MFDKTIVKKNTPPIVFVKSLYLNFFLCLVIFYRLYDSYNLYFFKGLRSRSSLFEQQHFNIYKQIIITKLSFNL